MRMIKEMVRILFSVMLKGQYTQIEPEEEIPEGLKALAGRAGCRGFYYGGKSGFYLRTA